MQPTLSRAGQSLLPLSYAAPPTQKDSRVHFPHAPLTDRPPPSDPEATKTWIYPAGSYPERRYQFEIVRAAIASNTLVCLPTGLGKTFIAAVVMLNFYRWFPKSKIVFLAPTRPLVKQQVDACYSIVGIPEEHTVELTGSVGIGKRRQAWKTKRVFFMTPQTMENDILRGDCPLEDVVCMVIDEAHRSAKAYAYNTLAQRLQQATNKSARIVGLSATPGSTAEAIQAIIDNLHCFRMEFRDELDADVIPYIHTRSLKEHVVALDDNMLSVCEMAKAILAKRLNRLCDADAFYSRSPDNLHKMLLISGRKEWLARTRNGATVPPAKKGMIEGDFAVANRMAHGISLLQTHGLVPFDLFLTGVQSDAGEKQWKSDTELTGSSEFQNLNVRVKQLIAAGEGHPKAKICLDVLVKHFRDLGPEQAKLSRAIIFVEYRDSVAELEKKLSLEEPLLRCVVFVGQAESKKSGSGGKNNGKGAAQKGMKQKQQNEAIAGFRSGKFNVLISTSIGEEGLDVGECDIIVMYDASKSPIRMTQRMGRTGRKRDGVIHFLVTKDLEERKLAKMRRSQEELRKMLRDRQRFNFTPAGPRLLSSNHIECARINLSITKRACDLTPDAESQLGIFRPVDNKKAQVDERENQNKGSTKEEETFLTKEGFPRLLEIEETASCRDKLATILYRRTGIISVPTRTEYFGHSSASKLVVNLIQTFERLSSQQANEIIVPFAKENFPQRPLLKTFQKETSKSIVDVEQFGDVPGCQFSPADGNTEVFLCPAEKSTPLRQKSFARQDEHLDEQLPGPKHISEKNEIDRGNGTSNVNQLQPILASDLAEKDCLPSKTISAADEEVTLKSKRRGRENKKAREPKKRKASSRNFVDDEAELSLDGNGRQSDEDGGVDDTPGSLVDFMASNRTPFDKSQLVNVYRKSLYNREDELDAVFDFRRPHDTKKIQDTPQDTPEYGWSSEYSKEKDTIQSVRIFNGKDTDEKVQQGPQKMSHRRRIVLDDDESDACLTSRSKEHPEVAVVKRMTEDHGLTVVVTTKLIGCSVVRNLSFRTGVRCLVRSGLGAAHLVVGSRSAVLRCSMADLLSKGVEHQQNLTETVRFILSQYREVFVVLRDELDRQGPRAQKSREFIHSDLGLATGVTVVTVIDDEDETNLLIYLAQQKQRDCVGLQWLPKEESMEAVVKFFGAPPNVSYPVAAYLATWPGSLRETIDAIMNRSISKADPLGLLEDSILDFYQRVFSRKQY